MIMTIMMIIDIPYRIIIIIYSISSLTLSFYIFI